MKLFSRQSLEKFLKIPVVSIVICITVSGCNSFANSPSNPEIKEVTKGSSYYQLKPKSVYDGDTFRVFKNGEEFKIRMACIDAPEKKQPLGIASRDYLQALLNKNPDKLIVAEKEKDRYGRTVAEVFLPDPKNPGNEIPVNGMMIKSGMAYFYADYASACKDNSTMYAQFEKDAQQSRLGVWANGNSVKPWDYRRAKKDKE